jgi:hypothetical protein
MILDNTFVLPISTSVIYYLSLCHNILNLSLSNYRNNYNLLNYLYVKAYQILSGFWFYLMSFFILEIKNYRLCL